VECASKEVERRHGRACACAVEDYIPFHLRGRRRTLDMRNVKDNQSLDEGFQVHGVVGSPVWETRLEDVSCTGNLLYPEDYLGETVRVILRNDQSIQGKLRSVSTSQLILETDGNYSLLSTAKIKVIEVPAHTRTTYPIHIGDEFQFGGEGPLLVVRQVFQDRFLWGKIDSKAEEPMVSSHVSIVWHERPPVCDGKLIQVDVPEDDAPEKRGSDSKWASAKATNLWQSMWDAMMSSMSSKSAEELMTEELVEILCKRNGVYMEKLGDGNKVLFVEKS
jgi:hypothetical protein